MAGLRSTSIANVQVEIERSVMEIAMLKEKRSREGHASSSTASLNKRIMYRGQKVHKQIAIWKGWYAFLPEDSAAAEPPPFDEDSLLGGQLPWVKALSGDTVCKEQLQLRMHRAANELMRTTEEQAWYASDAANILRVYLFQQHKLVEALISMQAAASAASGTRYMLSAQLQRLAQRSNSTRELFKRRGGLLD